MTILVGVLVAVAVVLWPRRHPRASPPGPPAPVQPRPTGSPGVVTTGDVAECADLLGVALSGGAGLVEGLDVVSAVAGGGAAEHLRVVSAAIRWGVPVEDAWRLVPQGWASVATAFVVAERAGVAPSRMLSEAGAALRRTQGQAAAVRAGELSARIALPLGLTFLPGFVLTTVVPLLLALARSLVGW